MRRWWPVLAVLFVVVPIAEIYLLIQIGQAIGGWWTILLLVADAALGSYLIKHEGRRAWNALQDALRNHRVPAAELADGALILVGGTLLLTPGFLSDVLGFFCVLPFTRPIARRILTAFLLRRFRLGGVVGPAQAGARGTGTQQRPGPDSVVQGEVVD